MTPTKVDPFIIELLDTTLVFEKSMRYNKKLSNFIEEEIQTLLEKGLIECCNSSWAAKVVMAPKGEDSWRMCMNYVGINS